MNRCWLRCPNRCPTPRPVLTIYCFCGSGERTQSVRKVRDSPMKDTLGVLLAGGAGERLYPSLATAPSPPSPPAECIGNHRHTLLQLPQLRFAPRLHSHAIQALLAEPHIAKVNILGREVGEFRRSPSPHEALSDQWYQGTARCRFTRILYSIGSDSQVCPDFFPGITIYKMVTAKMMKQHKDSSAEHHARHHPNPI